MLVASALEEGNNLLFGPAANAVSGFTAQRRCPPAVEQSTGQEGIVSFIKALFVHGKATWRVAGAAVACALNQIGTAVPQLVLGRIRLERARLIEQQVPPFERPAHIQRPRNVTFLVGLC